MLFEMAIALVVVGVIILTVFPALTAMRISSQRSTTQANLQALMRATAAFVQANGCVPCPTPATTVGAGFGIVRGDTSASPAACGTCSSAAAEGIPPYISLGVPASAAHDGWGHWIDMRIDPDLAGGAGFTTTVPPAAACQCSDFAPSNIPAGCSASSVGTKTTSCTILGASQKGLCTPNLGAVGNRVSVATPNGSTQAAAVIFASYGANGYGSFFASTLGNGNNGARLPFATTPPTCTSPSGCTASPAALVSLCYAGCNADGKNHFVDATPSSSYDDTLVYAGLDALLSSVNGGACTGGW